MKQITENIINGKQNIDENVKTQTSIDRTLELLDYFAATGTPLNITEISTILKMSRGAAYSMVNTMMQHSYVYKMDDGRYYLSHRCYAVGQAFRGQYTDLLGCYGTFMRYLNTEQLNWLLVADLYLLSADGVMFALIENSSSQNAYILRRATRSNRFMPWYTLAAGRILAASKSEQYQEFLLGMMDEADKNNTNSYYTVVSRETMKKEMQEAAEQHLFVDQHDIFNLGEVSIASPVYDNNGHTVAALNFNVEKSAYTSRSHEIQTAVHTLSRQMSLDLGYHPILNMPSFRQF